VSYDVVLTGFRLNTAEPPAKALERVLGLDPAKAKLATSRFPVIVARTSRDKADHLVGLLREVGAMVELRESPTGQVAQRPSGQQPIMRPSGVMDAITVPGQIGPAGSLDAPGAAQASPAPQFAPAGMHVPTMQMGPGAMPALGALPQVPRPPSNSQLKPATPGAPTALAIPKFVAPTPMGGQVAAPQLVPAALPDPERFRGHPSPEPANDASLSPFAPTEQALEPVRAAPARPMTAYQIGELSLDLGHKPAPAAAPPAALTPSLSPVDGAGLVGELELDVAPAPQPAPKAAAAVAAPLPAAPEGGGFGGMQTFGDGFDEMDQASAPALELDRDAAWRHGQAPAPAPSPRAASAAADPSEAPEREARPRQPQPSYVRPPPAPLSQRIKDKLLDILDTLRYIAVHALAVLVMVSISAAALAYAHSPDGLFELVGLAPPPLMPNVAEIKLMRASALPPLAKDARIHPLLRVAPDQFAVDVARWLRMRVPGIEHVNIEWPERDQLPVSDIDCMLLFKPAGDKFGNAANANLRALLRTGQALELPASVAARLEHASKLAKTPPFAALCLAL
jgi:hypothetical protein